MTPSSNLNQKSKCLFEFASSIGVPSAVRSYFLWAPLRNRVEVTAACCHSPHTGEHYINCRCISLLAWKSWNHSSWQVRSFFSQILHICGHHRQCLYVNCSHGVPHTYGIQEVWSHNEYDICLVKRWYDMEQAFSCSFTFAHNTENSSCFLSYTSSFAPFLSQVILLWALCKGAWKQTGCLSDLADLDLCLKLLL